MAKVREVADSERYEVSKDCQNCGRPNTISIPRGVKINDYMLNIVKKNEICYHCGCFVIEFMEKI